LIFAGTLGRQLFDSESFAILKRLAYRPNSIGYLSETFQAYGACVPSTLSVPQTQLVFYLSDELFALQSPILITLEAQSTAILKIQLASDRCAPTWQTHLRTSAIITCTVSAWPLIEALAWWPATRQLAKTPSGCVISFMNFKTSFKRCHQLETSSLPGYR